MDFFKSVFADEPDPPRPESESKPISSPTHDQPDRTPQPSNLNPSDGGGGSLWSFGGIMKSLTAKSESVIEIYRRDLMEFGSGLKKEIEVAHGSLENVSHKIDEIGTSVLKGTAQIISSGKDAILSIDQESDSDNNSDRNLSQQSLNSKPYSRFEAQVRSIQGDLSTFCEEPEDLDEFKKWRSGFVLEEKRTEIENLIGESGDLESVYERVVPSSVDEENFWCRYYYRVYKLKQAEDLRASLVKRAISAEEEDLSWDVDDDDEDVKEIRNDGQKEKEMTSPVAKTQSERHEELPIKNTPEVIKAEEKESAEEKKIAVEDSMGEKALTSEDNVASDKVEISKDKEEIASKPDEEEIASKPDEEEIASKPDEEPGLVGKSDNGNSSKDSEFSVVASNPSMPEEEEDLGWDEIEDLSTIDERKVTGSEGSSTADLRKRLSVADEEEDLSWDIDDDDNDNTTKS